MNAVSPQRPAFRAGLRRTMYRTSSPPADVLLGRGFSRAAEAEPVERVGRHVNKGLGRDARLVRGQAYLLDGIARVAYRARHAEGSRYTIAQLVRIGQFGVEGRIAVGNILWIGAVGERVEVIDERPGDAAAVGGPDWCAAAAPSRSVSVRALAKAGLHQDQQLRAQRQQFGGQHGRQGPGSISWLLRHQHGALARGSGTAAPATAASNEASTALGTCLGTTPGSKRRGLVAAAYLA